MSLRRAQIYQPESGTGWHLAPSFQPSKIRWSNYWIRHLQRRQSCNKKQADANAHSHIQGISKVFAPVVTTANVNFYIFVGLCDKPTQSWHNFKNISIYLVFLMKIIQKEYLGSVLAPLSQSFHYNPLISILFPTFVKKRKFCGLMFAEQIQLSQTNRQRLLTLDLKHYHSLLT